MRENLRKYELSHQKNIRDFGGLKTNDGRHIKYGRLFRGGAFGKIDEEDIKILTSLHLTDIVDFRSEKEFFAHPDRRLKGVEYHSFPAIRETIKIENTNYEDGNLLWFVHDDETGFTHLKKQYEELVTIEESVTAYKNFFKVILQDDKVTYFHCSQGKDRAGLASFLIETALGVSFEDALEDYLYSNIAMKSRVEKIKEEIKNKSFYNEEYEKSLYAVFSAKEEYLRASIETMNEVYGGVIPFLENILEVDIKRLKDLYLE